MKNYWTLQDQKSKNNEIKLVGGNQGEWVLYHQEEIEQIKSKVAEEILISFEQTTSELFKAIENLVEENQQLKNEIESKKAF